jgi:hypothetical protein
MGIMLFLIYKPKTIDCYLLFLLKRKPIIINQYKDIVINSSYNKYDGGTEYSPINRK